MSKKKRKRGPLVSSPKPKSSHIPDFDLGELQGFDPKALDLTDDVARFILVLAVVFNDMKGGWYAVARLQLAASLATGSLEAQGQVAGFVNQTMRIMFGVLCELTVLIRAHSGVIDSPEFQSLLTGLPKHSREAWDKVRRNAQDKDDETRGKTDEELILVKIRGGLAFHYSENLIQQSYVKFFAKSTELYHDKAMVSDGGTMEATRFYFADAAMEEGLRSQSSRSIAELSAFISELGKQVNLALKLIVMAYIKKIATLAPYKLPSP